MYGTSNLDDVETLKLCWIPEKDENSETKKLETNDSGCKPLVEVCNFEICSNL